MTKMSEERIKDDKVLFVGFKLRRIANIIFPFCFLAFLLLITNRWETSIIADTLVIAFIGFGWSFNIRFRKWEKANKVYIESLGFVVR